MDSSFASLRSPSPLSFEVIPPQSAPALGTDHGPSPPRTRTSSSSGSSEHSLDELELTDAEPDSDLDLMSDVDSPPPSAPAPKLKSGSKSIGVPVVVPSHLRRSRSPSTASATSSAGVLSEDMALSFPDPLSHSHADGDSTGSSFDSDSDSDLDNDEHEHELGVADSWISPSSDGRMEDDDVTPLVGGEYSFLMTSSQIVKDQSPSPPAPPTTSAVAPANAALNETDEQNLESAANSILRESGTTVRSSSPPVAPEVKPELLEHKLHEQEAYLDGQVDQEKQERTREWTTDVAAAPSLVPESEEVVPPPPAAGAAVVTDEGEAKLPETVIPPSTTLLTTLLDLMSHPLPLLRLHLQLHKPQLLLLGAMVVLLASYGLAPLPSTGSANVALPDSLLPVEEVRKMAEEEVRRRMGDYSVQMRRDRGQAEVSSSSFSAASASQSAPPSPSPSSSQVVVEPIAPITPPTQRKQQHKARCSKAVEKAVVLHSRYTTEASTKPSAGPAQMKAEKELSASPLPPQIRPKKPFAALTAASLGLPVPDQVPALLDGQAKETKQEEPFRAEKAAFAALLAQEEAEHGPGWRTRRKMARLLREKGRIERRHRATSHRQRHRQRLIESAPEPASDTPVVLEGAREIKGVKMDCACAGKGKGKRRPSVFVDSFEESSSSSNVKSKRSKQQQVADIARKDLLAPLADFQDALQLALQYISSGLADWSLVPVVVGAWESMGLSSNVTEWRVLVESHLQSQLQGVQHLGRKGGRLQKEIGRKSRALQKDLAKAAKLQSARVHELAYKQMEEGSGLRQQVDRAAAIAAKAAKGLEARLKVKQHVREAEKTHKHLRKAARRWRKAQEKQAGKLRRRLRGEK